jgi:hypothetical protein
MRREARWTSMIRGRGTAKKGPVNRQKKACAAPEAVQGPARRGSARGVMPSDRQKRFA